MLTPTKAQGRKGNNRQNAKRFGGHRHGRLPLRHKKSPRGTGQGGGGGSCAWRTAMRAPHDVGHGASGITVLALGPPPPGGALEGGGGTVLAVARGFEGGG